MCGNVWIFLRNVWEGGHLASILPGSGCRPWPCYPSQLLENKLPLLQPGLGNLGSHHWESPGTEREGSFTGATSQLPFSWELHLWPDPQPGSLPEPHHSLCPTLYLLSTVYCPHWPSPLTVSSLRSCQAFAGLWAGHGHNPCSGDHLSTWCKAVNGQVDRPGELPWMESCPVCGFPGPPEDCRAWQWGDCKSLSVAPQVKKDFIAVLLGWRNF